LSQKRKTRRNHDSSFTISFYLQRSKFGASCTHSSTTYHKTSLEKNVTTLSLRKHRQQSYILVNDVSRTCSDSDQFFCCVRESARFTSMRHVGKSMLGNRSSKGTIALLRVHLSVCIFPGLISPCRWSYARRMPAKYFEFWLIGVESPKTKKEKER
jgi:hypothetical protein